jgi:hypothetical protein
MWILFFLFFMINTSLAAQDSVKLPINQLDYRTRVTLELDTPLVGTQVRISRELRYRPKPNPQKRPQKKINNFK